MSLTHKKVTEFLSLTAAQVASGDLFPVIDVSAPDAQKQKSLTKAEMDTLFGGLAQEDIDTLAELNTILTDATLLNQAFHDNGDKSALWAPDRDNGLKHTFRMTGTHTVDGFTNIVERDIVMIEGECDGTGGYTVSLDSNDYVLCDRLVTASETLDFDTTANHFTRFIGIYQTYNSLNKVVILDKAVN